ncbi:MAG: tetratricopeptide repeat protein [Herpetosiphonaceae bacterium]|nr:tetratricopeptide repeat protein [Herpetosiphonaceae bacterium]
MGDKTQQADWHYQRGVVLEQSGRIAEAVEEYRQALLENPRLRTAHLAIARYYTRNGLVAKAADEWAAAIAIAPDYEALARLATAQIELKRYQEARTTLQLSLRLVPDDPFIQYELAYIEYAEGNHRTALDQLIELRPIYNDEWQLHHLMGNCQIKLGLYDAAQASFGRAMMLTENDDHLEELQASVAVIERLREFTTLASRKDRAYAEHGVMYLGSEGDDGVQIDDRPAVVWSYSALATTLRRALNLAAADIWCCDTVMPINRAAEPLARLFAAQLDKPLREPAAVDPNEVVLLVAGFLSESALLTTVQEHIPATTLTFALSLHPDPRPGDTLPDIIGLFARQATLPWEAELSQLRQTGAAPRTISAMLDTATARLEIALATLGAEPNAAAQVDYYRLLHRRLDLP